MIDFIIKINTITMIYYEIKIIIKDIFIKLDK